MHDSRFSSALPPRSLNPYSASCMCRSPTYFYPVSGSSSRSSSFSPPKRRHKRQQATTSGSSLPNRCARYGASTTGSPSHMILLWCASAHSSSLWGYSVSLRVIAWERFFANNKCLCHFLRDTRANVIDASPYFLSPDSGISQVSSGMNHECV